MGKKLLFTIVVCVCCLVQYTAFAQNELTKIADGFEFTEGPVWIEDGSYLLFSDISANKVYKWSPENGVEIFIENSGNSNGLAIDFGGDLLLAQHGLRQIGRYNGNGEIETALSSFNDKKLNSPNDLCVGADGTIYFTDPNYGVNSEDEELGFYGVYCIPADGSSPVLFDDELPRPNGITLSPDGWWLYVCDSERNTVYKYEMKTPGEVKKRYTFAVLDSEIDGIKTDLDGNVYVAESNVGVKVFSSDGELLKTIEVPERTRNMVWGNKYKNTLYICAGESIYSIKQNSDYPFVLKELLGKPTKNSINLNMMSETDVEVFVEYGQESGSYTLQTSAITCKADSVFNIKLNNLLPDRTYFYRVNYRLPGESSYKHRPEFSFTTAKTNGQEFSFVVHADPHLDASSNYQTYNKCLLNTLEDNPDFMIDLGDTFMSDKLDDKSYAGIKERALLFRHFYEKTGHSIPLFMAMGNHEAESGWELDGTAENIAVWNTLVRKMLYPNPTPNNFYTGDETIHPFVGQRENYYAWNWGDALFIVLDPYWYTINKPGQYDDSWEFTLGEEQYIWLRTTLEESNSKFKFVFAHQIIGGDSQGRGGSEFVKYFEMGGYNLDGTYGFDEKRQGWEKPLHQLFVENGVDIYFHGHDHFYAKQELDGVIYQLMPQPSLFNYVGLDMPAEYGYHDGIFIQNSGHLRIHVSDKVTVEYVRAFHEDDESKGYKNGSIADSYTLEAKSVSTGLNTIQKNVDFRCFPNPANSMIEIEMDKFERAELYNLDGILMASSSQNDMPVQSIPAGYYLLRCFNKNGIWGSKKIVIND